MKNLKITVNGTTYDVQVEETDSQNSNSDNTCVNSQILNTNTQNNQESFKSPSEQKNTENLSSIKSPMPGTIVSINVSQGQKVSKGDVLLILEAMKMENEIMAPDNMEISKISIKKGDSVETGQELILYK